MGAAFAFVIGCSSTQPAAEGTASAGAAGKKTEAVASVDNKSGAMLWTENCMRCHNLRSPADFTPDQWPVVVHEMRIRAGLTGVEQQRILQFLESASSHQ